MNLLHYLEDMKNSDLKRKIEKRINEFAEKRNSDELFKELCFCILTANFNAERCIKIQNEIDNGFLLMNEKQLTNALKKHGHRFPRTRAKYIIEARKHKDKIKEIMSLSSSDAREWLVKNIKGIGYKEASHFLRNVGRKDVAIIDFHIIDILTKHKLIDKPKTLTKRKYIEIENTLKQIAKKLGNNLAELDLYLWYCETGKVLK